MKLMPDDIEARLKRGERLEWWSIGFLITIIAAMYLAMGSSQAMKTAWIEDTLSLIPPILFIVTRRIERMQPTDRFPLGFYRAGSLGFFLSATALAGMGAFLIYDSVSALIRAEHPTIGAVQLFGHEVWMGWLMIAALVYSVIPPVILGRMKLPVARQTNDKVLHTDARMNAADWKTGLAGIAGIIGIGFGFWWADAAAAGIIALDILRDGLSSLRIAVAELLDGAPRKLGSSEIHPVVPALSRGLQARYPGLRPKLRETGRFVRATLEPPEDRALSEEEARDLGAGPDAWRVIAVSRSTGPHPSPARSVPDTPPSRTD